MKKLLTFAFSLLLIGNVWAADNTVIVTPGTGLTLRSRDVGTGIQSLQQILGDTSGNALATAPGTPNTVFALPIQGVTGGTAVPISGSITIASGSTTVVQPTGTNLHAVLDTTSTTAVTQATGTNLHAVIDSGTITAVTSLTNALPAGTNKIGTFDPATIATWGIAAASQNVAVPTNGQLVMGQFTTTPTTLSTTNVSPLQMDNAGNLLVNVKTALGLAQGSTTSGQTGSMIMGAVTTTSPAYTTAQTAYISLDTKGNLRSATINGGSTYQHVAASQTGAVLQTSTGAIGDYLSHCVIYPGTTAAGSVTVFDNTNAAATNVIEFTTGTLSNLAPITIPIGAISISGAWKVTTGANETVVCYGKFS